MGQMIASATMRGTTSRLVRSIDSTRRAESSSLTDIVPISAASPAPTVAARMIEAMNGPISRAIEAATIVPMLSC